MISQKNSILNIHDKIDEFHTREPIGYLVLDDFLEEEKFNFFHDIILSKGYSIVQEDVGQGRKNKTIFIPGEEMKELYDFFSSETFEVYISEIFRNQCQREFSISQQQIKQRLGEEGLIGQVYEKDDIFSWHVDAYSSGISLGSFIYYIGGYPGEWKQEYGGVLELGKGNWGDIRCYEKIIPKKNRIVFLLYSEVAFHQVTKNCSNFSRLSLQSTMIAV